MSKHNSIIDYYKAQLDTGKPLFFGPNVVCPHCFHINLGNEGYGNLEGYGISKEGVYGKECLDCKECFVIECNVDYVPRHDETLINYRSRRISKESDYETK